MADAGSGTSEADAAEIAFNELGDDDDLALNIFTFARQKSRLQISQPLYTRLGKESMDKYVVIIRESNWDNQLIQSNLVCPICKIYRMINQS